ncbi:HNH endonuclease [Stenotrophomonas maltophilia]|nr:HNH endonuclease [Stenotrophomonas maltophilia]
MRETWTDHRGRDWPVTTMKGRLKFKLPSHAALRAYVFHRDGYRCQRCSAKAVDVPADYDGRYALLTDTKVQARRVSMQWSDVLILDHVLTLKAGGRNHPDNLQALCETCNKKKQREDRLATLHAAGMRAP